MAHSVLGVSLGRRRMLSVAGQVAAVAAASPVWAQSAQTPIRIVVGFPAGGTIDAVARMLAAHMKDDLGASVIVDSRPGAGGQIAAQAVKQAPPDGRTLLLSPDHTMLMVPLTVKAPGFDPFVDFAPVGQVARYAGGFAVANRVPVRTLEEFFAWTKTHATEGNIGVSAPGSIPHFFIRLLSQKLQIPLASVPYKGSAPMVQDLMAGQIPAGTTALGDFVEPAQVGKLRILEVLGDQRSGAVPQVPTMRELGYPVSWEYWLGLYAPARTESAEVQRINASLKRVLALPEVSERMRKIVFEPAWGRPEDLTRLMHNGIDLWKPVVQSSGWVAQ